MAFNTHPSRDRRTSCLDSRSGIALWLGLWDGDGDEFPVAGVEEPAAGSCLVAGVGVGEAGADEVAFGDGQGCGEAAAAGTAGVDVPAAEPAGERLGLSGDDEGVVAFGAVADDLAEFAAAFAAGEQVSVIDDDYPRAGE